MNYGGATETLVQESVTFGRTGDLVEFFCYETTNPHHIGIGLSFEMMYVKVPDVSPTTVAGIFSATLISAQINGAKTLETVFRFLRLLLCQISTNNNILALVNAKALDVFEKIVRRSDSEKPTLSFKSIV